MLIKNFFRRYVLKIGIVIALYPLFLLLSFMSWKITHLLCIFFGKAIYKINSSMTKIARRNILLAFPDYTKDEYESLLERVHIETIYSFISMLSFAIRLKKFLSLVDIHGEEHLVKYADNVMICSIHMSSVYTLGQFLSICNALKSTKISFIINTPSSSLLYAFFKNLITSTPHADFQERIVYSNDKVLLRAVRGFARNKGVFVTATDQDLGKKNSLMVPFFGVKKSATSSSILKIATINKASIIFASGYWSKGRYQVFIYPPLENFPTGDSEKNATRMNRMFEQMIMKCPEHYLWFHKRFKTRSSCEQSLYENLV